MGIVGQARPALSNEPRPLTCPNHGGILEKGLGMGLGAGLLGAAVVALRARTRPVPQPSLPDIISPSVFARRVQRTTRGQIVYHVSGEGDPLVFLHDFFPAPLLTNGRRSTRISLPRIACSRRIGSASVRASVPTVRCAPRIMRVAFTNFAAPPAAAGVPSSSLPVWVRPWLAWPARSIRNSPAV